MKILYLDLLSGLSGDMFLGGLLALGVDLDKLERELTKLNLQGYHLHAHERSSWQIRGIKVDVHLEDHHHPHEEHSSSAHAHSHARHHHASHAHHHHDERTFAQIQDLIEHSRLSPWVRQKAVAIFRRIAEAEGKVHGLPPEKVHFHEVGAVDSIVDIVGGCIGLELLGRPRIFASPVVEGRGWVECAHGRFPVPAPATLEILAARGVSLEQCEEPHEMLTPTGAAILAELAEHFGPMPAMRITQTGYGLGTRQLHTRPNCVRMILGEGAVGEHQPALDWETDQVAVLETNVDDLNPEILGHFVEKALNQGALEVFYTPVTMKKNRPGVLLTLLCPPPQADAFMAMILRETSAFGVRFHLCSRRKLRRNFADVETPWGKVRVKQGWLGGELLHAAPEFESCRQMAEENGIPVRQVYASALSAGQPRPSRRRAKTKKAGRKLSK
ncbi:MAG: nickel pincer cofactor biosynthesis protein LarC [Verrucomicrobiae bacterium]|nr:nickel pincer cofactor biosynthesis protein LarC [Verrucomicrobiae bacterium]